MPGNREHPIVEGLTAMVVVALGFALLFGIGAALAGSVFSGDSSGADGGPGGEASMYLPKPTLSGDTSAGPLVSAGPESSASTTSATPTTEIVLEAGQKAVAPMQQIDLSGTYPGGDGAQLEVQRFTDGEWRDFGVSMTVSGEQFVTYIQTGQSGVNRIRVVDRETEETSNEVEVKVG